MRKQFKTLIIKVKILIGAYQIGLSYKELKGIWLALDVMLDKQQARQ